jgi:hypothetical protein
VIDFLLATNGNVAFEIFLAVFFFEPRFIQSCLPEESFGGDSPLSKIKKRKNSDGRCIARAENQFRLSDQDGQGLDFASMNGKS